MHPRLEHHAALTASATPSWLQLLVSAVALLVAAYAVWSNHSFRRRDALAVLLRRFEEGHFHVRMWRMEQLTRVGNDSTAIERRTVGEVRATLRGEKLALFDRALASDWSTERFDMQATYFFALQVREWLPTNGRLARRRAKELNATFGYQLLGAFLDQGMAACRLLPDKDHREIPEDAHASYYPTHYGLFDPRYSELVDWLADDLLRPANRLPGIVEQRLADRRAAIDALLGSLSPQCANPAPQSVT